MSKEAMKLALELLDKQWQCEQVWSLEESQDVADIIREALAEQPAQREPVATPMSQPNRVIAYAAASKLRELGYEWVDEAWKQPAQQEPVVRWDSDGWGDLLVDGLPDGTLLYTSPSNQPGYQAMAMAVTRLQKRCLELEGKQPAQQEPVAWANPNDLQNFDMKVRTNGGPLHTMPLYTSPQPAQHPKTKQIAECLAVLRPTVKGKFPHEQALEELVGYIAAPQPAQRKPLTDELLRKMHHEDQFGLFCDYDEFEQIARAIEAAHGITGKNT